MDILLNMEFGNGQGGLMAKLLWGSISLEIFVLQSW